MSKRAIVGATVQGTHDFIHKKFVNSHLLAYLQQQQQQQKPSSPLSNNTINNNNNNNTNNNNNNNISSSWCSSILGFGGYRVGLNQSSHQYALQTAIQSGVNLIDTSNNYMDNESEYMIGTVLSGMMEQGMIHRENLIVKSKLGYIQGPLLQQYQLEEEMNSGDDHYSKNEFSKVFNHFHWHCISPAFLSRELSRSLKRLQLNTLDVLYLHNPEYMYHHHHQNHHQNQNHQNHDSSQQSSLEWMSKEVRRQYQTEFYDKIRRAFEHLEHEVEKGRIQCYGISSNQWIMDHSDDGDDGDSFGKISIKKCLEIAQQVVSSSSSSSLIDNSGNNNNNKKHSSHHFKYIQMPCNIQENDHELAHYARMNDLKVVGNRPFNSIQSLSMSPPSSLKSKAHNNMYRFVDLPSDGSSSSGSSSSSSSVVAKTITQLDQENNEALQEWTQLINQTIYLELNTPFDRNTLSDMPSAAESDANAMPHRSGVSWGQILAANVDQLDSVFSFRETLNNRIRPEVAYALSRLRRHPQLGDKCASWAAQYNYLLNNMLTAYDKYLCTRHAAQAQHVKNQMDEICPDLASSHSLSQRVCRVLCSSGDVDSLLVGMRSIDYVRDVCQMGPPIDSQQARQIMHTVRWPATEVTYSKNDA